jgi:hypothetical protein
MMPLVMSLSIPMVLLLMKLDTNSEPVSNARSGLNVFGRCTRRHARLGSAHMQRALLFPVFFRDFKEQVVSEPPGLGPGRLNAFER